MLGSSIEILKVILDSLDKLGQVINDLIRSVLTLIAELVVTKDDPVTVHDVLLGHLELFLGLCEEELIEHLLVILIDHTISKHSIILVSPQLEQLNLGLH